MTEFLPLDELADGPLEAVRDWLKSANRHGYDELIAKFNEASKRGLWSPRSNSAHGLLAREQ